MLRLDPRLPLVWRTPTSCQFGSVAPVAVLDETTTNIERAVAVLAEGTSLSTLRALARQWHMPEAELDDFLTLMTPALEQTAHEAAPLHVRLEGNGDGLRELVEVLRDDCRLSGVSASFVPPLELDELTDDPELVIVVANFVTPVEMAGHWLRRDVPHLLIVNYEDGVRIGPLVVPGISPCAFCVEDHHRQSDTCWSALATQLMYATPPRHAASLHYRVACETLAVIHRWHRDGNILQEQIHVARHPRASTERTKSAGFSVACQCQSLTGNEIGLGPRRGSQKMTPTTS